MKRFFYILTIIFLASCKVCEPCVPEGVTGVASSGTFTKAAEMTGWATGENGIPIG